MKTTRSLRQPLLALVCSAIWAAATPSTTAAGASYSRPAGSQLEPALSSSTTAGTTHGLEASDFPSTTHATAFRFLGSDPDEDRSGYAASDLVIPASIMDSDFTLRFVYQVGEYLHGSAGFSGAFPYLRFSDDQWTNRINIGHQASPWTFFQMRSGWFFRPAPEMNDSAIYKGSASIDAWEDNFLVYHRNDASLLANAYWELDEYGGPRKDGTQHGHDMTAFGAMGWSTGHTPANPGAAVFKAGSTAYLAAPDTAADADLDFHGDSWTVAFLVNKTNATLGSLFSKRGVGGNCIDIKADTNLRFHYSTNGTDWQVIDGPALSLESWQHVVVRFDKGTVSMRVYGRDWVTSAATGAPAESTAPVAIGRQMDPGDVFEGKVDNVGVWQRALTNVECASLQDKGRDGYLRLYRGQDLMSRGPGGPNQPWDHEIPAGVDNDWKGGASLRLVLGANRYYGTENMATPADPQYKNLDQDFTVFEIALWTKALDTDRVYLGEWHPWGGAPYGVPHYVSPRLKAITGHPLRALDETTADRSSLYLLYESTDAGLSTGTIIESMAGATNLRTAGDILFTGDLPDWPGVTDDTLLAPPTDGPTDAAVTASAIDETHIAVDSISLGSSPYGPVRRSLYVHRGNDPEHAYIYRNRLSEETALDNIEVPAGWSDYRVTVDWVDVYGNVTRQTVNVSVAPPRAAAEIPMEALSFTGKTDTFSTGNWPLPVNEPMTLRFYLKVVLPSYADSQILGIEDGLTLTEGYDILRISTTYRTLNVLIGDGDKSTSDDMYPNHGMYGISATLTQNQWQEWWLQVLRPTSTQKGFIRLYRSNQGYGVTLVDSADLPEARDWWTDWTFKKWWSHLRLGENMSLSSGHPRFLLASVTWWTRILEPSPDILKLSWKDLTTLDREQRFADDLYWHIQPAPTEGRVTPSLGYGPAAHTLDMTLGTNVTYSTDTPSLTTGVVKRPLTDVVDALRWTAGLEAMPPERLPAFDLAQEGPSAGTVDLADASQLARIIAGLAN